MMNLLKALCSYALSGFITACVFLSAFCVYLIVCINTAHASEVKAFYMPITIVNVGITYKF